MHQHLAQRAHDIFAELRNHVHDAGTSMHGLAPKLRSLCRTKLRDSAATVQTRLQPSRATAVSRGAQAARPDPAPTILTGPALLYKLVLH